jgi:branched-subunit amino acid transport protein
VTLHIDWLIAVVGLLVGTYAVRALPFWFSGIERLPWGVHRFLELVPAAALGALIVPDAVLQAAPAVAVGVSPPGVPSHPPGVQSDGCRRRLDPRGVGGLLVIG